MNQFLVKKLKILLIAIRRYPQYVFLAYTLPCVVAFSILTPPMFAPDEGAHVMRAYSVSALRLLPEGINERGRNAQSVPVDLVHVIGAHNSQRRSDGYFGWRATIDYPSASWRSEDFGAMHNAEGYFPLFYVPQAVIVRLAWLFDISVIDTLRYGRLILGCLFAYFGYLALRIACWGKAGLLILLCLPISVFLGTSFSPDAWLIASTALAFALITRTKNTINEIDKRAYLVSAYIIIAASALRPTYMLMNSIWARNAFHKVGIQKFSLLFIGLTMALLWALLVVAHPDRLADGIDPQQQLAFLVDNPSAVFGIAWNTLSNFATQPLRQIFIVTDHPNAYAGNQLTLFLSSVILLIIMIDRRPVSIRNYWTWVIIGGAMLSYGLIYGAMYLAWTPIGSMGPVYGVQGRYFVPLLLMSLATIPSLPKIRLFLVAQPVISIFLIGYFFLLNFWTINKYFIMET